MAAFFRRLAARLAAAFRSDRIDHDLRDEIASHVAIRTDEHVRRGVAAGEARRLALIEFGGVASLTERHRDARGLPWIDAIRQDAGYALRMCRRSPWFFAGAALTLALGIGVNGAVFSIVRAVLLQPLPYRDPSRLVMVWHQRAQTIGAKSDLLNPTFTRQTATSAMANRAHLEAKDVMESATYIGAPYNLEAEFDIALADRAERLRGALATANFFDVLGVRAAHGRLFTPSDESQDSALVVLSDSLWRRAFGGNPEILGQPITLMAGRQKKPKSFTVIGILPPAFRFTYPQQTDVWTILPWSELPGPAVAGYWTLGRLNNGVSLRAAQARVAGLQVYAPRPDDRPENREVFTLEPITDWVTAETRPSLLLVAGVAALLLVIACATVASALFVRVT